MKSFEFFIAKRYIKARSNSNFITIISMVSIVGITIGIAALIVALSVFNGFADLAKKIFLKNDPHIKIVYRKTVSLEKILEIEKIILSLKDETKEVSRYFEGKVLLMKNRQSLPIVLKGLQSLYSDKNEGSLLRLKYGSDINPKSKERTAIIGTFLAVKNALVVNDSIFIISFDGLAKSVSGFSIPPIAKFRISGIYESFNKEFDMTYVFISYENAKKILGRKTIADGIEIRLKNPMKANDLIKKIKEITGENDAQILSWRDLKKDLYFMMDLERIVAFIILLMIIAVASFNLMGSLSMTVIEKKRDIALFRSLGVLPKSIRKIFMLEGIIISLIGIVAGSVLGYIICWAQINYKLYPLDGTRYIIDALPVSLRWEDFAAIAIFSLALTFIASYVPAKKASESQIAESLKWE